MDQKSAARQVAEAWLSGRRRTDPDAPRDPDVEARFLGQFFAAFDREAPRLPELKSAASAGSQVFWMLVTRGGLPDLSAKEAASWMVDGVVESVSRVRPVTSKYPGVDPWNSLAIRVVGDFIETCTISALPVGARSGQDVGVWTGDLFSITFEGIASRSVSGREGDIRDVVLSALRFMPHRENCPSLKPADVAAKLLHTYDVAVSAYLESI